MFVDKKIRATVFIVLQLVMVCKLERVIMLNTYSSKIITNEYGLLNNPQSQSKLFDNLAKKFSSIYIYEMKETEDL